MSEAVALHSLATVCSTELESVSGPHSLSRFSILSSFSTPHQGAAEASCSDHTTDGQYREHKEALAA